MGKRSILFQFHRTTIFMNKKEVENNSAKKGKSGKFMKKGWPCIELVPLNVSGPHLYSQLGRSMKQIDFFDFDKTRLN